MKPAPVSAPPTTSAFTGLAGQLATMDPAKLRQILACVNEKLRVVV